MLSTSTAHSCNSNSDLDRQADTDRPTDTDLVNGDSTNGIHRDDHKTVREHPETDTQNIVAHHVCGCGRGTSSISEYERGVYVQISGQPMNYKYIGIIRPKGVANNEIQNVTRSLLVDQFCSSFHVSLKGASKNEIQNALCFIEDAKNENEMRTSFHQNKMQK